MWRQVQKLFTNKLNAHEARLKVGKNVVDKIPGTDKAPGTDKVPEAASATEAPAA